MSRSNPSSPGKSPRGEQQTIEPYSDMTGPAFQIEGQLNEVYERRLAEINEEAEGDPVLKEITYKEWISMLREINKTLITNIQDMERETAERLALLQRKVNANHNFPIACSELCKSRKDIAELIQLVRNAKEYGDWSLDKYNFETVTEKDIFGSQDDQCCELNKNAPDPNNKQPDGTDKRPCTKLRSKLLDNVKALAYEVADKHDEVRELKKQILSMEDEIQKAQKKIQLKDDVIKELRNDLKALPKFEGAWRPRIAHHHSSSSSSHVSPSLISDTKASELDYPIPRTGSCSNRDSINSFRSNPQEEEENEEQQFIRCLKEELNQLFEMRRSYDQNVDGQKRSIQDQQARLCEMVDQLLKSNTQFHNKLRFYRRELLNLDNPQHNRTASVSSDADSGICSDTSDPDVKIVNSVRNRVCNLLDENQNLKKSQQNLQIQFEDVNCKALAKSELLDKTSKALREVADALSNATCKPIAYDSIFGKCKKMTQNPIVDAVDGLMETLKTKDQTICDLRKELVEAKRNSDELDCCCKTLRSELADIKRSLPSTNQSENRVMLFQNQEFSKRLLKQNEDLKNKVCKQEEELDALQNQICQLQYRLCSKCSAPISSQFDDRKRCAQAESINDVRKIEVDLQRKTKLIECLKAENAKLNEDLADIRRLQARAKLMERRPPPPPPPQPSQQDCEMSTKLNAAQDKCREQANALQKANCIILNLEQQIDETRKNKEIILKERDLLKTELAALKERQASSMGTQQSLHDQLHATIDELYMAKEQLRECIESKECLECRHRKEVNHFHELKAHLLDKYNCLVEDYNNVHREYQKVVQIEQEKSRQIDALNMWKKDQLRIEKDIRRKMEMFENHIRDLLADKERLLCQLEETENDNRTLLQAIDCAAPLSFNYSSTPSQSLDQGRGYRVIAPSCSNDPVSKVIQNVRSTTRKLSQQRCYMDDESIQYRSN